MKFMKFGKTALTAALSLAIALSLSSCIRSFTVGYFYTTGTETSSPSGNGIISGFKIDNNTGKLIPLHGFPLSGGGRFAVPAYRWPFRLRTEQGDNRQRRFELHHRRSLQQLQHH